MHDLMRRNPTASLFACTGVALACGSFAVVAALSGAACRDPGRPQPEVPGLGTPSVAEAEADPAAPPRVSSVPPLEPAAIVLDAGTVVDSARPVDAKP